MVLDVKWALRWLTLCAQAMAENRVWLIELDRAIGDSDHGENMDRGFQAVLEKLAEAQPETPGAALKLTAMTLMSKVGGAAGPLYGTAFLRASTALGDAAEIDPGRLADALVAARDGIVARGKAESGDKTMVDAWTPPRRLRRPPRRTALAASLEFWSQPLRRLRPAPWPPSP
ncbi:putative kinase MCAP_0235 [Arthrobacter sp. Hiyo4]|nr:putative kinase MCAP_0235 [Arthrobacter sp. Hiyo4]